MVLVFMLVAFGFFWGISGGKKKMALGMLALYVLIAIFPYLPIDAIYGNGAWWEIILLSILAAWFLTAAVLSLAPAEALKNNTLNLSPLTLKLFADLNPRYLP